MDNTVITSSSNDKIKDLKKLKDRKYRDEKNMFLVEGDHLVEEAYKSGNLLELILEENVINELDVKQTFVTSNVMKDLSTLTTPPKIMGVCSRIYSKPTLGNRIIMLDGIQDPGNLGAIIRSAVAFNIDTIVLGTGSVDIYNPKVLRATQGLVFHLNIIEEDLYNLITKLKGDNYRVLGTKVDGGTELKTYNNTDKFILIMGNEGRGMDKDIETLCDDFIYIKMNELCESLNVGIACSIILYQLETGI